MNGSVSGPGDIYDASGTLVVAGAHLTGGSPGSVLTSDATGNLSLQPAPAQAADIIGGVGSSKTLNLANGLTQSVTLTQNCALTIAGWPPGAAQATVIVIENATGGWIPTFPLGVTWIGQQPAQNTAANGISVYCFLSPNSGITVYGAGVANAFTGPPAGDIFDWYASGGSKVAWIDSSGRAHFSSGLTTGVNVYAGSSIYGADGNTVFNIQDVSAAVNYLNFSSATTGSGPTISPGSGGATPDPNIALNLESVGTYNVNVTNGSLDVQTAGAGLRVAEGSNAKQGTATLNGTTSVVVSNTSVTANSRIFLTIQSRGSVNPPGSPYVVTRTAAASFSIASTVASDNSVVAFEILEPG